MLEWGQHWNPFGPSNKAAKRSKYGVEKALRLYEFAMSYRDCESP